MKNIIDLYKMDNLFYLYKLTLLNYMTEDIYENNPLVETYLLTFIKSNNNLIDSKNKDLLCDFILQLTLELDLLVYNKPKLDIKRIIKTRNITNQLRIEVSILSKKIFNII